MKRDIALSIGGFPDYGTPHLADASYLLLSGSHAGCVYINTALGHRTIHTDNYSYATGTYANIYNAPESFYRWTMERLPAAQKTPAFTRALENYIGRDMTTYVIAIKKMLQARQIDEATSSKNFRRRIFRLPWLKKWKRKYFIAVHYPRLIRPFSGLSGKSLFPPPLKEAGV